MRAHLLTVGQCRLHGAQCGCIHLDAPVEGQHKHLAAQHTGGHVSLQVGLALMQQL